MIRVTADQMRQLSVVTVEMHPFRSEKIAIGQISYNEDASTIVLAPFNGSPAYKAGIRPGDVIAEVNDKKTDNLSTTEVADMLKGPRGTPVQIVVVRDGVEKPLTFNVIRDEISRKSVQDALWVKPGIAYVDVDQFNENTSKELEESLRKLGENNIHGLILDLRENPGGLLNEGVAVADHFLQKGQTIVSHRGRASAEKTYTAWVRASLIANGLSQARVSAGDLVNVLAILVATNRTIPLPKFARIMTAPGF